MALGWKLVVDAEDPHRQAAFWAEALEYVVEDHSPQIGQLLDEGVIDPSLTTEVGGRRAWRDAAATRHPDDPVDTFSGAGLGRRLLFQRVPERKGGGKNRLHVDVHTGPEARGEKVARLEALGAAVVREVSEAQGSWTVMADPEGNEFCVA